MKAKFLEAMRRLFPGGVASADQWRDVIWIFAMGYGEGLLHRGDGDSQHHFECFGHNYPELRDPAWRPDNSWKWW